ncbi:MAG TPA: GAF domain-containing sensor histidine kinase [Gemmatimonadales bacterium]|nr:GAF domain-containing sensor histidine kinase [Gemmatimonadales bacterium]
MSRTNRSDAVRPQGRAVAGAVGQRDRFERLLTAGLAIFAEHELQAVLQRVADAARDVVGARYAALGVLNEAGTGLAQFVSSGLSEAERARIGPLPQGRGLLGLVIRERRPIRTADITRHPGRYGFPPHHPPMKSFLGVPIELRDRVFGNLYLTEKVGADEFDAEDERIAVFLARKAGVAVENARLLERLREFQSSRDRFYAMMNHELRNALTGVYGWLDLLVRRDKGAAPPAALEALAAAEQTVQLLHDMLDLSRLDAGRVEVKVQDSMAEAMLAEALHSVTPLAEPAAVRLDAPALDLRTPMRTDPKRVRQILVNLLRNAIQHSPADEVVRVGFDADDSLVSFSVIDRGSGIDEERQRQLFDAYSQVSEERAGTGLGLTLSRRLARLLGGDLQVQSRSGHGATFTLAIPRFMNPAP